MTEPSHHAPGPFYGRWAIVLLLCTIGAWAFYYYVPVSWHAHLTWAIENPVQNDSTDRNWVPTWEKSVEKHPHFHQLKNHQCSVSAFQDELLCEFTVYKYQSLKSILQFAQDEFPWRQGWHTSDQNRQAIESQQEDLLALVNLRSSNQQEILALEKQMAPIQKTVERWVQERDLWESNKQLREKQLFLFEQLIPTMEETSELRKLYLQQKTKTQIRIREITLEIDKLNQTLETRAQPWLTKLQIEQENRRYAVQMSQMENKISQLNAAKRQAIDSHIPNPLATTWLWQKTDVRAHHAPGVFFAAWISLFLLLSHILFRRRKRT